MALYAAGMFIAKLYIIPEWQGTAAKRKKGGYIPAQIMDGGNDELRENTDENVDYNKEWT
eukprot:5725137-Pleurochrysis_carterae.AAC.1